MASRRGSASHPISAPNFESNHIHRPRLVDRLLQANGARVALVVASAGYGKTTLLSDFNRLSPGPVCWLRLSEADRDLLTLAGLVWASLERRFYRLKGDLDVNRMDGLAPRAIARRIAGALSEKVGERFAIVIEDLHLLEGEAQVLEFVQALVDELPENAFLLLSSRRVPDLKLVDLIAGDQVLTIGAEELAFDREELRDLLAARLEGEPDEDLLTALMNDTGGWVTGVLLSERLLDPNALPLNGRSEPMSFEYLADNAFGRVSQKLQDFMLRTAILPYMTAPICDELLEREDSVAFLEELVGRGLFTSVTLNKPRTYEYHHALSQFLRARAAAQLSEEDRSSLALKAAEILEAEGQEYSALRILLEAGHEEEAVALANRYTRELFNWAPASALERVGHLILKYGAVSPKAFMRIAVASPQSIETGGMAFWLSQARSCRDIFDDDDEIFLYGLEAHLAALRGDRDGLIRAIRSLEKFNGREEPWIISKLASAQADLEAMSSRWNRAIEILEHGTGEIFRVLDESSVDELEIWVRETISIHLTLTANYYVTLADFESAEARLLQALGIVDESVCARAGSSVTNNLGCILHHSGDYVRARDYLQRSIRISEDLDAPEYLAFSHASYADLLSDVGVPELAAISYRIAAECAELTHNHHLRTCIHGGARVLKYRFPNLPLEWVEPGDPPQFGMDPIPCGVYMNQVLRFDLSSDQLPTLELVSGLINDDRLNIPEKTLARLWRALLTLRIDQQPQACDMFVEAFQFAVAHGTLHFVAAYARHETSITQEMFLSSVSDFEGYEELVYLIRELENLAANYNNETAVANPDRSIQLRLLGTQSLLLEGNPVQLRPKHLEVLIWLTLFGPADPEVIREAIWPGASPASSASRLHTAIYEIRSALGDSFILMSNGQYTASDQSISIDAVVFEQFAESALLERSKSGEPGFLVEQAIDEYAGSFYPVSDHAWAVDYRRRLERLYAQLLTERSKIAIASGKAWQAVEDMKHLLELDPYNDQAHVLLLKALAKSGSTGEVVTHFLKSSTLYRNDLKIDVPQQIVSTYRALLG